MFLRKFFSVNFQPCRFIRRDFLDRYGQMFRPEVQAELENLAVETSRNKTLQIDFQLEEERRRKRTVRFHILRRKYVAHPRDVQVNVFVKNHLQFLHKNYPNRWNVETLAQSFDQTEENVRLILQQRTKRRFRVRPKTPSTTFGIADREEKEKLIEDHLLQRDLTQWKSSSDEDPVDPRVLAEESRLIDRERPSEKYLWKKNDGFFSNVIATKKATETSTLLDQINRLQTNEIDVNELDEKRMKILQTMQNFNDRIADKNDQKRKFVQRINSKKNSR